jgi:hypothetical protein
MRLCWWTAVVFSVLLCHQAAAQTAVQDRQAIYDQAQAAYDQHDWAASSVGFARLLPAGAQPLRRSEAVIASRLATALLHLDRLDEAQAWADRAVAAMPPSEPALVEEALLVEADVARARYDYPAAIKAYDQADALMAGQGVSDQLFRERMGLGFAGVTVDPAHVLKQLTAMSDDPSFSKTVNKQVLAQVEDLEARAAVNLGDTVTAARLIRSAVSDSGGLTTGKVSTSQVALRADAGIISRLRHDDEATHRYLAYTGAGHLEDMSWILDRSGELPVCDDVGDGVRSDDSVVITFAIADDGRVVGALPIYASRTGRLGETFARAVSTWRWDPDAIKKVDPFWRATLQLELRCVSRPRPAELGRSIQNEGVSWLRRHGVIDTAELASLKEGYVISVPAADPRRTGPDAPLFLAVTGRDKLKAAAVDAAFANLDADKAPAAVYAYLIDRYARDQARGLTSVFGATLAQAHGYAAFTPKMAKRFAGDRALAWLYLQQALAFEDSGDFGAAQPLLQMVLAFNTTALPDDDALRRVTLLHRAIGLDRSGYSVEATKSLEQSGLTQDQCSLIDTHPVPQRMGGGAEDFPQEAERWQFQGFAQEDYDIADDGHVNNVRTVLSYPPYIFDASTEHLARSFRFVPPRLGGKSVGCQGREQIVKYSLQR